MILIYNNRTIGSWSPVLYRAPTRLLFGSTPAGIRCLKCKRAHWLGTVHSTTVPARPSIGRPSTAAPCSTRVLCTVPGKQRVKRGCRLGRGASTQLQQVPRRASAGAAEATRLLRERTKADRALNSEFRASPAGAPGGPPEAVKAAKFCDVLFFVFCFSPAAVPEFHLRASV